MIFYRLLLLILLSASAFLSANEIEREKFEFEQLVQQLDKIQDRHNIPTYALVITDPEKVLFDQIRGVDQSGSKKPVSNQAYFRIGSITKTFVSIAAVVAEKSGKLNLTDEVTDYLGMGQFKNSYKKEHPVTLEQLLEHSGGFADMSRAEFAANDVVTLQQGLQEFAKDRVVLWPPGQMHSYSNTSYGLAGRVLEIATKNQINDWLTHSVFEPLGMKSATMEHSKIVKKNLIPGYQADGEERIPYWNMIYTSLGAINLQPRDMAKLIQFYLKRGAGYLSEKQIQRIETPKTTLAAAQGLEYGYGLGIYQWYRNGHLFHGHGGDADGYLAHFAYQKQAKLGYFLAINTFNNRAKREMQSTIESFITENLRDLTKAPAVINENLSRLEGLYYPASSRFNRQSQGRPLSLKWAPGKLMIKEAGQSWEPLVYLGNDLFRRPFESDATTAIFFKNGKFWFQGDEGNFLRQEADQ